MPLDFIPMDDEERVLMPGDKGFLVRCKPRWKDQLPDRSIKYLSIFKQLYFEDKCPEEAAAAKAKAEEEEAAKKSQEEVEMKDETAKDTEDTNGDSAEAKKDEATEGKEDEQAKSTDNKAEGAPKAEENKEPADYSGIRFKCRELVWEEGYTFISCNLADPGDFMRFMFVTIASNPKAIRRPKFPLRFMPVDAVFEARPKALEVAAKPLIEEVVGKEPDRAFRFSLNYKKTMVGSWISQHQASAIVRNLIWSVNPNCVPCIKQQDFAVILEIMEPLFCFGIAPEYFRLGSYHTSNVCQGFKQLHTDSEDDISDDPDLSPDENSKRVQKIKRKIRKAMSAQGNDKSKKQKMDGSGEEDDDQSDDQD